MGMTTLDRIVQGQGFGSRKACRALIQDGLVLVRGEVVSDIALSFELEGLEIEVAGEAWTCREKAYIALNKPAGYECTRKPSAHPSVLSLLPYQYEDRGLQSVGRLDHDTTGLLLLSNDGPFIHAQTSPKRHVPKVYLAATARPADAALVAALLGGVLLEDEDAPIAANAARLVDERTIEIVLEQGKYHQVKRMLAAAGNHCAALKRIAIGGLRLEDLGLAEGAWKYLDARELDLVSKGL